MASRAEPDPIRRLFWPLLGIFFGGGLLASTEALIVPRLQLRLDLGFARALTVQLVYYAGYLLFAFPATMVAVRVGTMRAVAGALATMALGCLALADAQATLRFDAMLAALLLLSAGVTVLQIACNGLVATTGARAAARFTLLQGFNALGTVVGPLASAWLLLGGGDAAGRTPFLMLAALFMVLAAACARERDLLPRASRDGAPEPERLRRLLRTPNVARGIVAIFAYVGAEVTIGTLAVAYLTLSGGLAANPVAAGRLVSLYWAGAMVGRFAGAVLLRRMLPARLLAQAGAAGLGLVAAAMLLGGVAGGAALLAVGLGNSIMFPTIYGLAMPRDAEDVPAASMLLCMAVVGGAVVPMLTGLAADRLSLRPALVLPGLCYLVILRFARRAARIAAA